MPSTLGVEQPLEGPIAATEVLDLSLTAVYQIAPEQLDDALAASLAAGEFWRFPFNYRPDYRAETHLHALDLSQCDLDDLLPVMGLSELELLKILPRSELSKKLGGCTFDTPAQVAKLQLQLLGMG